MSIDAYINEKLNEKSPIEKEPNEYKINYSRSDAQKILDKIRRLITAMDMELESESKMTPHLLSEYAKLVIDEVTIFV